MRNKNPITAKEYAKTIDITWQQILRDDLGESLLPKPDFNGAIPGPYSSSGWRDLGESLPPTVKRHRDWAFGGSVISINKPTDLEITGCAYCGAFDPETELPETKTIEYQIGWLDEDRQQPEMASDDLCVNCGAPQPQPDRNSQAMFTPIHPSCNSHFAAAQLEKLAGAMNEAAITMGEVGDLGRRLKRNGWDKMEHAVQRSAHLTNRIAQ